MIFGALFAKFKIYILAAAIVGAFLAGWSVNGWRHKSMETSALKTAIKKADIQTETDEKVLGEATAKKQETRVVYKTIYKEVARVKDSDCVIGADVIRVWNEANRQAGTSTPR